jgi:hypothetical protein
VNYDFFGARHKGNDMYDITDDVTGELHYIARRHIPVYVNETRSTSDTPTVHARHDCEGALHYLLGHAGEDDTPFRLKADGETETEILYDYGANYESVRIRKGFTRPSPDDGAKRLKDLENDEHKYLEDIESYSLSDMSSCLEYLWDVIVTEVKREFGNEFILRSLVVSILLKARARSVENEITGLEDIQEVVTNLGHLVNCLFAGWMTERQIKQEILSRDLFGCALKNVLKRDDLESLSPQEFRDLIDRL